MAQEARPMEKRELTLSIAIYSVIAGVVLAVANGYLGLYAGMTISGTIPAAAVGLALFKRRGILEINIFQTGTSAGEALVAGAIFVIPAFVISGVWEDFLSHYWEIAIILALGGTFGILLMIPYRKPFITDGGKEAIFPEGVACGEVLLAKETKGTLSLLLKGGLVAAGFKVLQTAFVFIKGTWYTSFTAGKALFTVGTAVSPAMMGVGYIVGVDVGIPLVAGGLLLSMVIIPIWTTMNGVPADGYGDAYGATRIIGVGAMIIAGTYTIWKIRGQLMKGIAMARKGSMDDIPLKTMLILDILTSAGIFAYYWYATGSFSQAVVGLLIIVPATIIFVAVSCYIVGLVGSSNNPVSGMIIFVVLGAGLVMRVIGWDDTSALILVAAIVGTAACMAGDIAQNLKTGEMVKANPKAQQQIQLIVGLVAAFTIPAILVLLHASRGIGIDTNPNDGLEAYAAPQASMVATLAKDILGGKGEHWTEILIGLALGAFVIFIDEMIRTKRAKAVAMMLSLHKSAWVNQHGNDKDFDAGKTTAGIEDKLGLSWRMYPMALAVGMYLPIEVSVPILLGGLIGWFAKNKVTDLKTATNRGTIFATGIIAGEAMIGVLIAVPIVLGAKLPVNVVDSAVLSLAAFGGIMYYLYRVIIKPPTR